jgi:hypothetical protein
VRFRYLFIISLTLALTLLVCACELKRKNPLDPTGNPDVFIPPKVTIVNATGSGAGVVHKYIEIKWNRNNENTSGYYIYLGLAYNSAYAVVDTFIGNPATTPELTKRIDIGTPGHYYLKMSAYETHSAGNLEGQLSDWVYAYVAN